MTSNPRRGPLRALFQEYQRAAAEFERVVAPLTYTDFVRSRNETTEDEDFRSVQTVVRHVVQAGYAHANHVRVALEVPGRRVDVEPGEKEPLLEQLHRMLAYMEASLEGSWHLEADDLEEVQIRSAWGTCYDLEQMLEHAIVHILRHRRQIEGFLASAPPVGQG